MIAAIIAFAVQAGAQMKAAKGDTTNVKQFLTNPSNGIQTIAGKAFAEIISTYERIDGKTSQGAIVATIDAIETVRRQFEEKVRSLGNFFLIDGGNGAIATINGLAAQLTKDRQTELAAIGGSYTGGGEAVLGGFSMMQLVIIGGLVLLILFSRKG